MSFLHGSSPFITEGSGGIDTTLTQEEVLEMVAFNESKIEELRLYGAFNRSISPSGTIYYENEDGSGAEPFLSKFGGNHLKILKIPPLANGSYKLKVTIPEFTLSLGAYSGTTSFLGLYAEATEGEFAANPSTDLADYVANTIGGLLQFPAAVYRDFDQIFFIDKTDSDVTFQKAYRYIDESGAQIEQPMTAAYASTGTIGRILNGVPLFVYLFPYITTSDFIVQNVCLNHR